MFSVEKKLQWDAQEVHVPVILFTFSGHILIVEIVLLNYDWHFSRQIGPTSDMLITHLSALSDSFGPYSGRA